MRISLIGVDVMSARIVYDDFVDDFMRAKVSFLMLMYFFVSFCLLLLFTFFFF